MGCLQRWFAAPLLLCYWGWRYPVGQRHRLLSSVVDVYHAGMGESSSSYYGAYAEVSVVAGAGVGYVKGVSSDAAGAYAGGAGAGVAAEVDSGALSSGAVGSSGVADECAGEALATGVSGAGGNDIYSASARAAAWVDEGDADGYASVVSVWYLGVVAVNSSADGEGK